MSIGTPDTDALNIDSILDGISTLIAGATPAGENHIGEVGGNSDIVNVTFSLDTNIYAAGDVLADTQIIAACMRANDKGGVWDSLLLIDKDAQGVAMTIYLLDANVSMGTENSAPSISDANTEKIIATLEILATDWKTLNGVKFVDIGDMARPVKPVAGSDDLYAAIVLDAGTPTFSATGLFGRFGFKERN